MKMPNVYVGQLADIRYGAIYSNITEAVKEVCRAQQAGMVICFIYLPDSPDGRYWIAGAIGPAANTKWNLIFTNSSEAEQHIEKIRLRGFSQKELFCRELKINTKGPDVLDIKTEEHFQCERELNGVKAALERGLKVDNTHAFAPIILETGDAMYEATLGNGYGILDINVQGWQTPDSYKFAMAAVSEAAKLLAEISQCDPDQQPRKWARLQQAALTFFGTYEQDDTNDDNN